MHPIRAVRQAKKLRPLVMLLLMRKRGSRIGASTKPQSHIEVGRAIGSADKGMTASECELRNEANGIAPKDLNQYHKHIPWKAEYSN